MSENRSEAQQIADAYDRIRLLQEQLDRAQSASLRSTPSLKELAKS